MFADACKVHVTKRTEPLTDARLLHRLPPRASTSRIKSQSPSSLCLSPCFFAPFLQFGQSHDVPFFLFVSSSKHCHHAPSSCTTHPNNNTINTTTTATTTISNTNPNSLCMYATASLQYKRSPPCDSDPCSTCYDDLKLQCVTPFRHCTFVTICTNPLYTPITHRRILFATFCSNPQHICNIVRMYTWMFNASEFRLGVAAVSGPMALMVALWGMTSSGVKVCVMAAVTLDGYCNP